MLDILLKLLPLFMVIVLGFICRASGLLGDRAKAWLTDGIIWLFQPVMLFHLTATVDLPDEMPVSLWAAYLGLTVALLLGTALFSVLVLRSDRQSAAVHGMGAGFGNTVMLGIPFNLSVLGTAAVFPISALVMIHAPVLIIAATLFAESGSGKTGRSLPVVAAGAVLKAFRNPLVVGITGGALYNVLGFALPEVIEPGMGWFRQITIVLSVFAIGASLSGISLAGDGRQIGLILIAKLIVHPAIMAVAVLLLFDLPPLFAAVCLLNACLPSGFNAFLFSLVYKKAEAPTASAILIGTVLSLPLYAFVAARLVDWLAVS